MPYVYIYSIYKFNIIYYILYMEDKVIISKKYYIKRDGKVYRIKDDTEVTFKSGGGEKAEYYKITINYKSYYVHRLIAKYFVPNPENKPFVDHINRNTHDNRAENLRWVTHTENMNNRKENYCEDVIKQRHIIQRKKHTEYHKIWRQKRKLLNS